MSTVGTPARSEAVTFSSMSYSTPYPTSAPPVPPSYYTPSPVHVPLSLTATQNLPSIPGAGTPQTPVSAPLGPILGIALSPSLIPPQQQVYPSALPPEGSLLQSQPSQSCLPLSHSLLQPQSCFPLQEPCISAQSTQVHTTLLFPKRLWSDMSVRLSTNNSQVQEQTLKSDFFTVVTGANVLRLF